MMRKAAIGVVAGLALCSVGASQAASVNLLSNGSFEDASVNPGTFVTLTGGSTAITGWKVTDHSIDYIGSYWQAADGSRSLDLNGNGLGGVELTQTLSLTGGQTYELSFAMAGNPDSGPTVKTMQVWLGSTLLGTFSFDTTGKTKAAMGWQDYSVPFTPVASGLLSLTFRSLVVDNGPYYGPALDNVSVSAVPLPGAAILFGTALLGAGVLRSRMKKTALSA